jgi:hypothetical protein
MFAGAAGVNERAVDVEEENFHVGGFYFQIEFCKKAKA